MNTEPKGPTNKDLVAFAKSEGFEDVSERQLRRWRDEGLLPDLIPASGGWKEGVKRFNPPGTEEQLRVLLHSRDRFPRKMIEWAWALWTAGYPVTPLIREYLLHAVDDLEQGAIDLLDQYEEDPEEFVEVANNLPKGVANFLRGVEEPQVPLQVILSMAAGRFHPTQVHEDFSSIEQALDRVGRVLGISGLKLGPSREAEPFLKDVARTIRLAGLRKDIAEMPDSELEDLRDTALFIYGLLWQGSASTDGPMEPSVFAILLLLQRFIPNLLIPEFLSAAEGTPALADFEEQFRTFATTGKLTHRRTKDPDHDD